MRSGSCAAVYCRRSARAPNGPSTLLSPLPSGRERTGMRSPGNSARFASVLNTAGPFLGLLFVFGLFALSADLRPHFFTGANFKIILIQTVIVAIGALGMTMIIISGGIDLSVGSVVALGSVLGATALVEGYAPGTVIVFVILAGGLIGFLNGAMIAGLRMMPFIVSLGMM